MRVGVDVLARHAFSVLHDVIQVALLLDERGVALALRRGLLVAGVVVLLPVLHGRYDLQNLLVFIDTAACRPVSFQPFLVALVLLTLDVDKILLSLGLEKDLLDVVLR